MTEECPMSAETVVGTNTAANVEKAVPFFGVTNMETSLRYYIDGLGFEMKNKWTVDGRVRWCWLECGRIAEAAGILGGQYSDRETGRGDERLLHVQRRLGVLS